MSTTCDWKFMNSGVKRIARLVLNNGAALANLKAHLFVNNRGTPDPADTLASYTECSLSGYGSVDLAGATWVEDATSLGVTQWHYGLTVQWTFTAGGQTLYGAYFTNDDDNLLVAAGVFQDAGFPAPFLVPSAGGIFQMTFAWQDKLCT